MGYYGGLIKGMEYEDKQRQAQDEAQFRERKFQNALQQQNLQNQLNQRKEKVNELRWDLQNKKQDSYLKKEELYMDKARQSMRVQQEKLNRDLKESQDKELNEVFNKAGRSLSSGIDSKTVANSINERLGPKNKIVDIQPVGDPKKGSWQIIRADGKPGRIINRESYQRFKGTTPVDQYNKKRKDLGFKDLIKERDDIAEELNDINIQLRTGKDFDKMQLSDKIRGKMEKRRIMLGPKLKKIKENIKKFGQSTEKKNDINALFPKQTEKQNKLKQPEKKPTEKTGKWQKWEN